MIGSWSTLAWAMLIGLIVVGPMVLGSGTAPEDGITWVWLVLSGAGNLVGLLLVYRAFRVGAVGIVAPIVSTEGAIAAIISVATGEPLSVVAGVLLGAILVGVAMVAAASPDGPREDRMGVTHTTAATLYAVSAAFSFGLALYATGRVGDSLPASWAVLPARLLGVVVVAIPLLAMARLRLTRQAFLFVLAVGLAEVVGILSFAVGAADSIAVSAVLASQFAAIAAVAAHFLFGERLSLRQAAGGAIIVFGVALLTAVQA